MASFDLNRPAPTAVKSGILNEMSNDEFVKAWRTIVGEPPAVMLDSRADMVRVLHESVLVATPYLVDRSVKDGSGTKTPKSLSQNSRRPGALPLATTAQREFCEEL